MDPSASFNVHQELALFWQKQMEKVEHMDAGIFREAHHTPELPLARIKKIMKLDDDVKQQMISAEAPVLFSKAAEMFIEELTLRAWIHTEENKRKTLQKNDIAMAISKYDQFDFLIDIVPREEIKPTASRTSKSQSHDVFHQPQVPAPAQVIPISAEQLQMLVQQATANQQQPQTFTLQNGQLVQANQIVQPQTLQMPQSFQVISSDGTAALADTGTFHQFQLQAGVGNSQQAAEASDDQQPSVYTQVVTSGGVQHVPIKLSAAQLEFLKVQFQGSAPANPSNVTLSTTPGQHQASSSVISSSANGNNASGNPQALSLPPNVTITTAAPPVMQATSTSSGNAGTALLQQQHPGAQIFVQQQLANGNMVYVPLQQTISCSSDS